MDRGAGFGPGFLKVVGVDAGEAATGFDFDGAGGGGGEKLEGLGDAADGEGDDALDLKGGDGGMGEEGGTGLGDEVAAVDGEVGEVGLLGEGVGEAGTGEGAVEFVKVNGVGG